MKHKLLYVLPLIVAFTSGCFGNKNNAPAPIEPLGTFSGQFRVIHNNNKGKIDSAKANLVLEMENATGYKVTGDTATVHAGSHGGYVVYPSNGKILFVDQTFPLTGTPTKIHLSGLFDYSYDGTNLQIAYSSYADTLTLYYKFKKN
jgi:hypothetical protein